ncbi:MAG: glycoside hydrolase family 15 protein [Candidatus Entotheonellia bacterium]
MASPAEWEESRHQRGRMAQAALAGRVCQSRAQPLHDVGRQCKGRAMRLVEIAPLLSATAFVFSALQVVVQLRNVWRDRFVFVVTDFMPIRQRTEVHPAGQDVASAHRIMRLIRCTSGAVAFTLAIKPTFAFATEPAEIIPSEQEGALFKSRPHARHVHAPSPFVQREDQASATVQLQAGEAFPLVLTYRKPNEPATPLPFAAVQRALEETRSYWEVWSKSCAYQGEYRDSVLRSALTLKLLTFEPTGAIVAAPTTSLPEAIGGVRNWDYRFTWLRDATFTLTALMNLGYVGEARDFLHFLKRARACPTEEFQILYGIHGERDTREEILAHLDGYRGSKPVRVGNAAAGQTQLDIYGELLDCIYLYLSHGGFDRDRESFLANTWLTVESVAEYVVRHWRDPDSGIWEARGGTGISSIRKRCAGWRWIAR